MRRSIIGLLGTLLGVLLLLGLLLSLGATAIGSRLLVASLPGVTTSNFNGPLFGRWQADELIWQQGELIVTLEQPELNWSAWCLLRRVLCIESLKVAELKLEIPPSESNEPFVLPELNLPLDIEIGQLEIEAISLGDTRISNVHLIANGKGKELLIHKLAAKYGEYALALEGKVATYDAWQSTLNATLDLPKMAQKPWSIRLAADGPLTAAMTLEAQSQGYLNAELKGTLAPLEDGLPADLSLTSNAFQATDSLPHSLTLQQVKLKAKGDLNQGYTLKGTSVLPGEAGPIALTLDALVDGKGAKVKQLTLIDHLQQQAKATGSLNWQQAFAMDAVISVEGFMWQSLYPSSLDIKINNLNANVKYDSNNLDADLAGDFVGPAGDFSLSSKVHGQNNQYQLDQLLLKAGQGQAQGHVNLSLEPMAWQGELQVKDLDPAFWLKELPGRLSGRIRSTGQSAEVLSWQLDSALSGELRGNVSVLNLQGRGQGQTIELPLVELKVGDNRIDGHGSLNERLSAELDLNLNRLHQLWPGLAGTLTGKFSVQGSLQAPQGTLTLAASALGYRDVKLAQLHLNGSLTANQHLNAQLKGQGLKQADTELGTLTVSAQGDYQRHQLRLDLEGGRANLELALAGGFSENLWQGSVNSMHIAMQSQDWQLQAPIAVRYQNNQLLKLGAHCFYAVTSKAPASLCAGEQQLLPTTELNYRLVGFDLDSLSPWLPKNVNWQGLLNAQVALKLTEQGPRGTLAVDAGQGLLRLSKKGQWHEYSYQALTLDGRFTDRSLDTNARFGSQALGQMLATMAIEPRSKSLKGQLDLNGFDLSIIEPFVAQIDEFAGLLNGQARITGTLLEPYIEGNFAVRNARASGADLPTRIEDLNLDLAVRGQYADLRGNWRGGQFGLGTVDGTLSWQDTFHAKVNLNTQRLPIWVEPYANLEADSQLSFELSDLRLAITGKVDIPRGEILIRELPPSTVKLSPDAVIVGDEVLEEDELQMAMNVQVSVGRDKLTFKGFGLSAELEGQVNIGDNLDTRGTLDLKKGRYRAYGQRLTIRRARMFFAGPIDQPYVDVEAIRKVDDVIAGIRLNGNVQQPSTTLFSEPSMSQEQALSYLVLGRPLSTGNTEDNNMLGQAALALGLAGSASLTSGLANALGIQDFELDTQGSGVSTSVVASGRITDKLSLRYGVGVFEPANTLALRYELTRRLYLEAASGFANSIDVFYKRDY